MHSSFDEQNINPLPDEKILGLPKLKAFEDDKLDVTQNVKVVFDRIENIVGKEENAGYLFPKQALVFTCLHYKSFENTVGKGEIAPNEQFLLFSQFSTLLENSVPSSPNSKLSSASSFNME